MPGANILDAFPAFETFWQEVRRERVSRQIERWEHEYMAPWPELLAKQKECYAVEGFDWRRVARKRVFPYLEERLPRMRALHEDLLDVLPRASARARKGIGIHFPLRFVIYVGIGCGAGWATTYGGKPACLFGLENAAREHDGTDGWSRRVVAHEVAHLAPQAWRGARWEERPAPWWSLYEEGFATYCERKVEPHVFPMRTGREEWLPWCDGHRAWLARKFLRDVAARRSVRPFFGSWYNVRGHIETGYYLGSEVIHAWTDGLSLREIARLTKAEIRRRARENLLHFAGETTVRP